MTLLPESWLTFIFESFHYVYKLPALGTSIAVDRTPARLRIRCLAHLHNRQHFSNSPAHGVAAAAVLVSDSYQIIQRDLCARAGRRTYLKSFDCALHVGPEKL